MNSSLKSLNIRDIMHGILVSVGTAILTTLLQMISARSEIDLKEIGLVAISAFLTYLLKQFGSDENGRIGGVL